MVLSVGQIKFNVAGINVSTVSYTQEQLKTYRIGNLLMFLQFYITHEQLKTYRWELINVSTVLYNTRAIENISFEN